MDAFYRAGRPQGWGRQALLWLLTGTGPLGALPRGPFVPIMGDDDDTHLHATSLIYINARSQKIACLHCTERADRALKLRCALLITLS